MGLFDIMSRPIGVIRNNCIWRHVQQMWCVADVFILIAGVAANATLLWLFLKGKKTLSASQVLGMHLVVMGFVYLSVTPATLVYDIQRYEDSKNNSSVASHLEKTRDVFSMFNLIGCPLLQTCMCIERYLAVVRPMLYLRLRKWEYRLAVSAGVWVLTLSFCLAIGLVDDVVVIMVPISVIVSWLFIVMLFCLGGVVHSLWQQSPVHSQSPLKRRAVANVLAVVVPAVLSYFPVLLMVPLIIFLFSDARNNERVCVVFELSMLFPKFGVLIGPLFYLSQAKQMCCLSGTGRKK